MLAAFFGCMFAIAVWAMASLTLGNFARRKLVVGVDIEELKLKHFEEIATLKLGHAKELSKQAQEHTAQMKEWGDSSDANFAEMTSANEALRRACKQAQETCDKAHALARSAIEQRDAARAEVGALKAKLKMDLPS